MQAHFSAKVPPTPAWQRWAKRWVRRKMAEWLHRQPDADLLAMALMERVQYFDYHEFFGGTHYYVSVASAA